MAKKKSWFNLLKRFFVPDTHSKPEKKEKRRKWVFGRLKVKRFASITAPATPSKERTVSETEEEQSKHALTVAIATAAAAEAAVAAAQVAAEVVKLAGTPQTTHQCEREIRIDVPQQPTRHQCVREILELAAIKIQTAFRGYLAKKALRALKGIVRLQAIIRGRNVRRQAITTLKCLQSIVNIQSQVCARRFQMGHHCGENDNSNKQLQTLRDKIIKMDSNGQRRWDDSVLTKKEADAVFLSKKEAIMKRERIKEYAFSHRKSAEELEQNKPNGRWRYWLDQWVDTQVSKSKELEDLDTIWTPNRKHREDYRGKGLRQRSLQRHQYHMEGPDSPFHRKQNSLGDEKSFSSSPLIVPTYMAATESAKAKARSTSSPKLRAGDSDTCSESYSPYKHKLSLKSPLTSEVVPGRIGRASAYQQRSPSLKSVPGPIKSSRTTTMTTIKDLSLNSECSLLNWDRQSTFR